MSEASQHGGIVLVVSHRAGDELADRMTTQPGPTWVRASPESVAGELARRATEATNEQAVAVVAIGGAAAAAVDAAAGEGRVAALCLLGGRLEKPQIGLLAEWPELALLSVADPSQRPGLRSTVDAYLASTNPSSDLWVGVIDDDVLARATNWLVERSGRTARVDEVTFLSSDGWELHATRWLPRRAAPVPGIVLLHSGRSDRGAYARLERLLAEAGLAVLNVDWRGRGQSTNLGSYFELASDVKAAGWRDALAAIEHLAAHPDVNSDRIGVVGVVHGAEYAVRAAHRDARVRALVVLTGYRPDEPEEAPHLVSGAVDVLYVTSTDHQMTTAAMRSLHDGSPGRMTQYVEYPGGAIGYQLFELDPTLEPRIVAWLCDVLEATSAR